MKRLTLILPALLFLACGSMSVKTVSSSNDSAEGVRVQVPELYEITVVMHDAAQRRLREVRRVALPSQEEHHVLNFKGGQFKSRELKVETHPGGTLKEFGFVTKSKATATVDSLTSATSAISDALLEIEEAQAPAAVPNPTEVENQQHLLDLLNAMLEANLEAIRDGRPIPYPDVLGAAGGS